MTFCTRVVLHMGNNINKLNTLFSQLQEKDKLPHLTSCTGRSNRHRKRHTSQSLYPFCCWICLSGSPQNHRCFGVRLQGWALRAGSHREEIWHYVKNLKRLNMSLILVAWSQFLIYSFLRKQTLPIPPKEPFKISLLSVMGFTELFTRSQLPEILNIHMTRTVTASNLLLQAYQPYWQLHRRCPKLIQSPFSTAHIACWGAAFPCHPQTGVFLKKWKIKTTIFRDMYNLWAWRYPPEELPMLKSSPIVQQNNPNCNNPQMLEEMIPSLDTGPVSRGLASPSQPCPAGQSELRRCTAGLLSAIW